MVDSATPLCTWAQFTSGAFADMGRNYSPEAQTAVLLEATRMCEQIASRRLVPFTAMVETHRAQGIDPDEAADAGSMSLDLQGSLGRSYASALGGGSMVRHCWLNELAVRYPEYWTYSNVSVAITRSYGGSQTLTAGVVGPEVDSGHVLFNLGTFLPVGSLLRVTYSGGYTAAIPADLVRAGKLMTASLIVRELQPSSQVRDPDQLRTDAEAALAGYARD